MSSDEDENSMPGLLRNGPGRFDDDDSSADDSMPPLMHRLDPADELSDDDSMPRLARRRPRWGDMSDSDDDDDDDSDSDGSSRGSMPRLIARAGVDWDSDDDDDDDSDEDAPAPRRIRMMRPPRLPPLEPFDPFADLPRLLRPYLFFHQFQVPPVRDTERADSSMPGLVANDTSDDDDTDSSMPALIRRDMDSFGEDMDSSSDEDSEEDDEDDSNESDEEAVEDGARVAIDLENVHVLAAGPPAAGFGRLQAQVEPVVIVGERPRELRLQEENRPVGSASAPREVVPDVIDLTLGDENPSANEERPSDVEPVETGENNQDFADQDASVAEVSVEEEEDEEASLSSVLAAAKQLLAQDEYKNRTFHQFPLLQDELKVYVLSFVAQVPFERACKKPTVTHVLPLVSQEFNALCRSNYLWRLILERLVLKDPSLWKDGLLKLHQCDASNPNFVGKVHHGMEEPGYERLYRMVVDQHLRFTGPVHRIQDVVRLGEEFRMHFSERKNRQLVQRVMDGFQTQTGGAVVPQNGQFPTFVCAHMDPFAAPTPACLVEIRQCTPNAGGSAIVSLMPVAHVWMERLWNEEGPEGIRLVQCMRMDHESSRQLTEDYAEVRQTAFGNPVIARYRRDRYGNIDSAARSRPRVGPSWDILDMLVEHRMANAHIRINNNDNQDQENVDEGGEGNDNEEENVDVEEEEDSDTDDEDEVQVVQVN